MEEWIRGIFLGELGILWEEKFKNMCSLGKDRFWYISVRTSR
jgi:hypothetical protein